MKKTAGRWLTALSARRSRRTKNLWSRYKIVLAGASDWDSSYRSCASRSGATSDTRIATRNDSGIVTKPGLLSGKIGVRIA